MKYTDPSYCRHYFFFFLLNIWFHFSSLCIRSLIFSVSGGTTILQARVAHRSILPHTLYTTSTTLMTNLSAGLEWTVTAPPPLGHKSHLRLGPFYCLMLVFIFCFFNCLFLQSFTEFPTLYSCVTLIIGLTGESAQLK